MNCLLRTAELEETTKWLSNAAFLCNKPHKKRSNQLHKKSSATLRWMDEQDVALPIPQKQTRRHWNEWRRRTSLV